MPHVTAAPETTATNGTTYLRNRRFRIQGSSQRLTATIARAYRSGICTTQRGPRDDAAIVESRARAPAKALREAGRLSKSIQARAAPLAPSLLTLLSRPAGPAQERRLA